MKPILEFDDAGADDDERVKGVTVGDIRAWHDQYENLLDSWAECRDLLSRERAVTAKLVGALRGIEKYSSDIAMVNAAHAAINEAVLAIPTAPIPSAPASCNHWPGQKRCGVCGMGTVAVSSQNRGTP